MARKRYHSGSDSDWSPTKDSSSSEWSPSPKKTRRSPNTDSSTKKKAAGKRTNSNSTPGRRAVSRDIFQDDEGRSRVSPGVTIKKELDISGLSAKWLLCQYCKRKKFDRKIRLDQHQKRCEKKTKLFYEIVEQLQDKKLKIPARVCFSCQQAFVNASHLRRHNRMVHGDPYFQEHVRIESKVYLKERPRERKPYPCSYCGKNCHRADRVQAHERRCRKNINKSVKTKECPHCDKTFASDGFLKRHVEVCGNPDRAIVCETCGNRFIDEASLRNHRTRHSGIKPFACQSCEMKFYKSNDLKKHDRTHTGDKPYKCKHCDKNFARTDARNNHEKTHSQQSPKPFKCDRCEKSFSHQGLKIHMRKHYGEPPFSCDFCKESFVSKVKLKKHMEVHTVQKYKCAECEQSFYREDRLEKHIEREHGTTEVNAASAEKKTNSTQNSNCTISKNKIGKETLTKSAGNARTTNDKNLGVVEGDRAAKSARKASTTNDKNLGVTEGDRPAISAGKASTTNEKNLGVAEGDGPAKSIAGHNMELSEQFQTTNVNCEEEVETVKDSDHYYTPKSNGVSEEQTGLAKDKVVTDANVEEQDEAISNGECNAASSEDKVEHDVLEDEIENDDGNVLEDTVENYDDCNDNVLNETADQETVLDETADQENVLDGMTDEAMVLDETANLDSGLDETAQGLVLDETADENSLEETADHKYVLDESVDSENVLDESVDPEHVVDESMDPEVVLNETMDAEHVLDETTDQDVDKTVDQDESINEQNEYQEDDSTGDDDFDMSVAEASSEEDEKEEHQEPIDETSTSGSDMSSLERMKQDGLLLKSKDENKRTRRGSRDMMAHEIVNLPNASYDNFDVPTEVLIDYEDEDPSTHMEHEQDEEDEHEHEEEDEHDHEVHEETEHEEECLACQNEHCNENHDSDEECRDEECHDEECLACKNEMRPIVEARVMKYIKSIAKELKIDEKLRHELQLSSSEQTDETDVDAAEDNSSKMDSCCTSISRIDEDSNSVKCPSEVVVKEEVQSDNEDDDDEDEDSEDEQETNENCEEEEGGVNGGAITVKVECDEASAGCDETTVYTADNGDCDETNGNETNGNDGDANDNGGDGDGAANETNGDCDDQGSDGNNDDDEDDNDDDKDECDDTNDEETGEEGDGEDEDEDSNDVNETNGDETSSSKKVLDHPSRDSLNEIPNNNNSTKDNPNNVSESALISNITTDDVNTDSYTDRVDGDADGYMEQFRETEVLQSLKELCENYEELSSEDEEMCCDTNIKSRDEIVSIIQKETQFLETFDKDSMDNSTDSEVVIMQKNVNCDLADEAIESVTVSSSQNHTLINGASVQDGNISEISTNSAVKKKGRPKSTGVSSLKSNNIKRGQGRPKVVKVKACRYCQVSFEVEFLRSHKKVCAEKPSLKKKAKMSENGDVVSAESRTTAGTTDNSDYERSLSNTVAGDTEQLKKKARKRKATVLAEDKLPGGDKVDGEQIKKKSRKRKLDEIDGDSAVYETEHRPPVKRGRKPSLESTGRSTCQYCQFRVQKSHRLKSHEDRCIEMVKQFEYLEKHPEVVKETLKDGKKFRCHFCIKDCKSRQRFEQHWRLCQQRKLRIEQVKMGVEVESGHSCQYCHQKFLDENKWQEHEMECRTLEEKYEQIMQSTPIRPVYECKKCGKVFPKLFMWERHKQKCVKVRKRKTGRPKEARKSSQGSKTPSTQPSLPTSPDSSQSNSRTLKRLAMDLEFDFTPPNINSPKPSLRSTQPKSASEASSPAKSTTSMATLSPTKSPISAKDSSKRKGRKGRRKQRAVDLEHHSKLKQGGSAKSTPTSSPVKSPSSTPKKSALQLKSLQLKKKSLHHQQTSMQMKRHSFRCRYCNEYCCNIEKLITHERKCLFLKDYSELPSQLRAHFGPSCF